VNFALHRLPALLLAFLPVVWGNCPYWFVGAPGSAETADEASAEPACPCCRKKAAESTKTAPDPTNPFDCGDCPMLVARNGSMPAPAAVALPDFDESVVAFAPLSTPVAFVVALDLALAAASARGAAGPPTGPPGSVVSRLVGAGLLDEVSLRI
jgi:hypothetical protein